MKTVKPILLSIATAALAFSVSAHAKKEAKEPSLLEVAIEVNSSGPFAGQFTTLLAVAGADEEIAGLLGSKGQYTVFAPINSAFDALFVTAAENCVNVDAGLVNAILKYHVAKGRRDAAEVLASEQIRTLLGAFFAQDGGVITDNAGQMANFVATDVPASNGIIHAIDTVLLPFPVENQCP
jgi:uncharacterized surface protein with fasciclin (FAS1) repeats